jgi:hypothetical protein
MISTSGKYASIEALSLEKSLSLALSMIALGLIFFEVVSEDEDTSCASIVTISILVASYDDESILSFSKANSATIFFQFTV